MRFFCEFSSLKEYKWFFNVVYVYVCKKCEEKFGGYWRLFSWLGQKVTYNNFNTHACTVPADQEDLTT